VLPADWPYREASHFLAIGPLRWHFQFHPARKKTPHTLVLLHGTGASTHSWTELIEPLSDFACVLAVDLPGHGFTTGAASNTLTLPRMAEDFNTLIRNIGLEGEMVLVGHSAGAPLAVQWALGHGQDAGATVKLKHIIGLNPSLVPPPALYTTMLGPVVAPIATSGPMTGLLAFIAANTSMVDQLLDSTESKISESQRKHYRYLFSQSNHVQGAMGFMAGADLPSILARSSSLATPVSFLIGANDTWVREAPLKTVIRESFPRARVVTWPGGHLLHEERPKDVAKLIHDMVFTA
jgi:magnesium chelatase accessory protein